MTADPSRALTRTTTPDGVAVLTLDVPGAAVNTISPSLGAEFDAHFAALEGQAEVRAVVLVSGKRDNFIAGADVELISRVTRVDEAERLSRDGQLMLSLLASFAKPVVAAIHGACLGGGLETALACSYRLATDDDRTKLGLPEVQLGLLPGAGGTQRLPRLVGLATALDLMLTGRQLKARKAKKIGLVDEVVPPSLLLEVAVRRAADLAAGRLHPTRRAGLPKADEVADRLRELALEDNPVGRAVLFRQAKARLLEKTHGHYPAPERIIDVVRVGSEQGFEAGLEAEARAFGELAVSDVSRRLVEIFFATTALKKDPGVDGEGRALPIQKVGIVGAGLMGAGIAYVTSAVAGWHVRLLDRDDASLGRGLATVHGLQDERLRKRRITRYERDRALSLVSGGIDSSGFAQVDLVVEAVFEDLALKHRVLAELEPHLPSHAIVASNTSSLPIAKIAAGSIRPERVVGMHYFSPVHKMPLLEVITHASTLPEVTRTAVAVGKAQGKTVIVVRDGPGFYTSRILAPYMNEAAWLLSEGARIEELDAALVRFGFPVGPVTLLDEVGIDVGAKVGPVMEAAFGTRMKAPGGFEAFIKDGRLGRKALKGFYRYDGDKRGQGKQVDPAAYDLLPTGRARRAFPSEHMTDRLVLQMVNEAAWCMQEQILRSPRDGDVGAVFGLGFPPFLGGPLRYLDTLGAARVAGRLEALAADLGERFRPAPILSDLARRGGRFHAR